MASSLVNSVPYPFQKVYLIADCHLGTQPNDVEDFIQFLNQVENNFEPNPIVILGDFFHVWATEPRLHTQKNQLLMNQFARLIPLGFELHFVIGNRDIPSKAFSYQSSPNPLFPFHTFSHDFLKMLSKQGKTVFFHHGDTINSQDRQYLLFRKILRSFAFPFLLKLIPKKKFQSILLASEENLKSTNQNFRKTFPQKEWETFCQKTTEAFSFDFAFFGHFHPEQLIQHTVNKASMYIIPDWQTNRNFITIHSNGDFEIAPCT